MTTPLRPTKAGTIEVQRLLRHHTSQALQALHGEPPLPDAAVHEARKQLKKARADLRLLRAALGSQRYAYENTALRDAARPLTTVRDARVLLDTLATLVASSGAEAQALDLDAVRLALQEAYRAVRHRVLEEGKTLGLLATSLQTTRARAKQWPLERRGWSVLGVGVKRVYRQGREAFAIVQADPSPEHLHTWRKQVKYLWHQLQMLQPIQLGRLTALVEQAHTLANTLGDDHDLAVLADTCRAHPDWFPAGATRQTLADLIARRRTLLQAQALTLGHGLYADKPSRFVDGLHASWRAWRGKAPQATP